MFAPPPRPRRFPRRWVAGSVPPAAEPAAGGPPVADPGTEPSPATRDGASPMFSSGVMDRLCPGGEAANAGGAPGDTEVTAYRPGRDRLLRRAWGSRGERVLESERDPPSRFRAAWLRRTTAGSAGG